MVMDVPRVRGLEAVATLSDLGFASVSAGVIARRRPMARLLERVQADARAVKRIQRLRKEFGRGPVELVLPGRRIAVVIDPEDVGAVLANSPRPFDPANREKRKALQWFQPHGVLISQGAIRSQRRAVNDAALDSGLNCTGWPIPSRPRSSPKPSPWRQRRCGGATSILHSS